MPQGKIKKTDSDKSYRRVMGATTLAGDSVRNTADENLGKIKELMIDVPSGKIAYAVLSFGGVLNMGNKLFAVPWSLLTLDEDEKEFILDVPKERLENAPGFDKDNWPDMADEIWGNQIHNYYGTQPYWETESREHMFRGGGGL
ncbi:MAG TPA: PRC-barrel domain-containing protein [Bryobacteraceae bacterium]|nr:PRC-barrel domain-containing protein [Bryobacteraceae bacterium]